MVDAVERERADVVIVGCRVAGSAAAASFAHAGRRVVALDRAKFPSDTLSTHIMSAGAVAEAKRVGALERILATGAPRLPVYDLGGHAFHPRAPYTPVEGVDFGLCVRRPGLDQALVETARDAGADVRENSDVQALVWAGGRAAGVRYRDPEGEMREIRAKLVVGADGKRSRVARWVGVEQPYRRWHNGRGMVFRYFDDPRGPEERNALTMWRLGDQIGFIFPTYDGTLCLLQPPLKEITAFRADPEGMWAKTVPKLPPLAQRLRGCTPQGKIRIAPDDLGSYFRVSTGPGWALVGDAGHFKDPVIGQGMHDGLRFGRLLAEATAEHLDSPEQLDERLYLWELDRDRSVMPSVYFAGGRLARPHPMPAPEVEMFRQIEEDREFGQQAADWWARNRPGRKTFTWRRRLRWTALGLLHQPAGEVALSALEEMRLELGLGRDLLALRLGRRARIGRWLRWGRNSWSSPLAGQSAIEERGPRTPWISEPEPADLAAGRSGDDGSPVPGLGSREDIEGAIESVGSKAAAA